MIKYLSLILLILLSTACQQDFTNNDDYPILPLSEQIDFNSVSIMGDLTPFSLNANDYMDQSSTNQNLYTKTFLLNTGIYYTMYFTFNNDYRNMLLWSGKDRGLEIYNPTGYFQTIPKTRPRKITFKVTNDNNYTIYVDLDKMQYGISSLAPVTSENLTESVQFLSSRYNSASLEGWNAYNSQNSMSKLSSDYYAKVFTNLVPGQSLNFKFSLNTNQYDSFTKDPENPYTVSNQLVDSQINNDHIWQKTYLTKYITSEFATLYFSPVTRRYSIEINNTPMHGDGYLDTSFYGSTVLSNTNANPIIKNVYIKDNGSAFYVAVDASFKRGVGLPYSGGLQVVLFIDNNIDNTGVTGNFSLYPGMPSINIDGTSSVEYIVVLEANKVEKSLSDGTHAIERGARLIGPINNSMTHEEIANTEKILPTLSPGANYGYFLYSDIYEIVIPKKYSPDENTSYDVLNIPSGNMFVCAIAWNVGTAWGNPTNTGINMPIADSIPYTGSTTNLQALVDWKPPN
ncbi:MAG: hypothetical protein KAS64_03360 [Spirochaetes bacterium]|nr:hypothetical protein [Spirochaetota bacterium]